MELQGAIFDLDGVLVDTAKYHYLAWKALADRLGFYFSPLDNERLKGVSRMDSLDILLEVGGLDFSAEEKMAMAEEKNTLYLSYIMQMTPDEVFPGVTAFLTLLHEKGIRISLGSASKNARIILDKLCLMPFFDAIADGTCVSKAKPDPEVFLVGAQKLGLAPETCIVFEDAVAGVEAAHRGGMKCIGVGNESVRSLADAFIEGFADASHVLLLMNSL